MTTNVASAMNAGKVGRYFTVVSALPATIFVSYVYVLVRTHPWSGAIQWSRVGGITLEGVGLLGLAALVLALAMNPLQFRIIQVFEGYWGRSGLAVELATIRTVHHRRLQLRFEGQELAATAALGPHGLDGLQWAGAPDVDVRRALIAFGNHQAATNYPDDASAVLPTRLGNILRRYETTVGKQYGMDALAAIPRLAMVGNEREVAYVENQRVQLKLALRTAFLGLLASPVTALLLWRQGAWLLLTLAPYAVAFFAYRGSLAIAHEYGTSLGVLTDLNRFALYERLRLKMPADTHEEKDTNTVLMKFFNFQGDDSLPYQHPPPKEREAEKPTSPDEAPNEE